MVKTTSSSPGVFFSNQGTLTVAGTGGTPAATAVLAIQNVTITPKHDTALARGWGSNLIIAQYQYNFQVDVDIEYIEWDPTVTTNLQQYILNAAAGGTYADTNTPPTFTVVVKWTSSASVIMDVSIANVVFKQFDIDAKYGDMLHVKLTGTGSNVTFTNS